MKNLLVIIAVFVVLIFIVSASGATSRVTSFPSPQGQTISCNSDDMQRHHCAADTRGGVQLIRQRSEANCIYGQTWGFDRSGIWVDRGCRADFQLTNRR